MVKASDLSDAARSILHILDDGVPRTAMEISGGMAYGVRSVRRALNRLQLYCLVKDNVNDRNLMVFRITKLGKGIVNELHPQPNGVEVVIPQQEVKAEPNHQIYTDIKNANPNIVSWLRAQAESFLMMANQLEAYED